MLPGDADEAEVEKAPGYVWSERPIIIFVKKSFGRACRHASGLRNATDLVEYLELALPVTRRACLARSLDYAVLKKKVEATLDSFGDPE